MKINQAKKLSLPEIMARLGYSPKEIKKGGNEYWYASPFRKEQKASFHTSYLQGQWIWNDFGDSGGNVLDFIIRHENTDVSGALAFLDRMFPKSSFKTHTEAKPKNELALSNSQLFILDNVLPLKSAVLENYLKERAINVSIAKNYLKVVQFHHAEKGFKYFGLGIKNLSGDYEVRNPKLKAVVGKKDISFIAGTGKGRGEVAVFEGFMDYLSFLTDENKRSLNTDVIILNSTKLVDRSKDFISQKGYQKIYTFFDNDKSGQDTAESFAKLSTQIVPCNHRYEGFNDYNEALMHSKKQSQSR